MQWHGDNFLKLIDIRTGNAARAAAAHVREVAKEKVNVAYPPASKPGQPPAKRTGRLRQRIVSRRMGLTAAKVVSSAKYAAFLELGTPGGKIIVPKTKKVLSWIGPDGKRIFRRKVVQGAIQPRPHLRPALDESREKILSIFSDRLTGAADFSTGRKEWDADSFMDRDE
jgi:hypothetical protein